MFQLDPASHSDRKGGIQDAHKVARFYSSCPAQEALGGEGGGLSQLPGESCIIMPWLLQGWYQTEARADLGVRPCKSQQGSLLETLQLSYLGCHILLNKLFGLSVGKQSARAWLSSTCAGMCIA